MGIENPISVSRLEHGYERTPSYIPAKPPGLAAATIDCSPAEQMSPALDRLSLKFAIWARDAPSALLDVGCGDGVATVSVLARGGHVVAVDPDEVAMGLLIGRIPPEHLRRLKVRLSTLADLEFKAPRFSAVHVSRVLHRLDPVALTQTFRKFFRWLYPDGKLFVSTFTPAGPAWAALQHEFRRRKMARHPWPGYFDEPLPQYSQSTITAFPLHLLDEPVLIREFTAAGFVVEDVETYSPAWAGAQQCCSVVARCAS
jgi:ubiquinone/menaquinone biosynthesis C-methylase UbiE